MKTLQYSFAQIEAFATIAETGSLSQAAIRLAKDRTTLRDLLDYLEDALGYRLFSREGRSLTLTAEGEQLFRQAHLLLRQAQAFESFAQTLPQTAGQALRLVYDPFVPREFLCALADNLARRQIRLSCWSASRREAEQALSDGVAEMAICQANNRTLGSEMEWRALGTVDLRFYAADSLFHDAPRPLTLLNLSLTPQLVMHRRSDDQIARRLQISGHTLYMNEITLLRHALEQGRGWGFLPDHLRPGEWQGVSEIATEVGSQGLNVTMVMLWLPGMNKHRMLSDIVHERRSFGCADNKTPRSLRPRGACHTTCYRRLRANEVDVSQFRLERVALNSLNFDFFFFAINNDGQNFAVKLSFVLHVPYFVVVQFDSNRSSCATVDDCRELVSCAQAAARTLTLLFTYFCVDSKH